MARARRSLARPEMVQGCPQAVLGAGHIDDVARTVAG